MRMAVLAGIEHTGHDGSPSTMSVAHSIQKKLCPHGISACVTRASLHTKQRSESVGLVLFAGDGRVAALATLGYDQILDSAVLLSKLGESPAVSSFELQIAPRSPRPPELDELLEHDPELENAPVLGNGSLPKSIPLNSEFSPLLYSDVSRSVLLSKDRPLIDVPFPVRTAMCASISLRAVSTLSGSPVTSNTGSLSRLGVTIYVCVWCWIRLMVAPFGPTTNPTTRYGTRTWMVT